MYKIEFCVRVYFSNQNLRTWPKGDIVPLNCKKKGPRRQFVSQRQLVQCLRPR